MYFVESSAVSVRPTIRFLDWLNQLNQNEENNIELNLEQIRSNSNIYLIPEQDTPEEVIAYIDEHFETIFLAELSSWSLNEDEYPQNRTLQMFWEFFDIEVHDTVCDLSDDDEDDEEI